MSVTFSRSVYSKEGGSLRVQRLPRRYYVIGFFFLVLILTIIFIPNTHKINAARRAKSALGFDVGLMEGPLPMVRPEEIAVVVAFNNAESHYLPRSSHNKEEYARSHGYHYIEDGIYDNSRVPAWGKILTLLKYMKSHPEIKWFWWIDIDTVILDPFIKLEEHILGNLTQPKYAEKDFVISWDCNGMNAGSFMIRNSPWSQKFLERVYAPEYAHRFGYAEQGVFQFLYQTDEEAADHYYFVNQRKFNAFPPEACGELDTVHTYHQGDFLIHFAGCWIDARNNCQERFNEFWNRRIPAPVHSNGAGGYQLTYTNNEPLPTLH